MEKTNDNKRKINWLIDCLNNEASLLVISFFLVAVSVITGFFIPSDGLIEKIIVTCVILTVIILILLASAHNSEISILFSDVGFFSFLFWCVICPVVLGAATSTMLHIYTLFFNVTILCWIFAVYFSIFSIFWFSSKLYKHKDIYGRLDLYSTIWIAILTLVLTVFDLQENIKPFALVLAVYMIIQIFIKLENSILLECSK